MLCQWLLIHVFFMHLDWDCYGWMLEWESVWSHLFWMHSSVKSWIVENVSKEPSKPDTHCWSLWPQDFFCYGTPTVYEMSQAQIRKKNHQQTTIYTLQNQHMSVGFLKHFNPTLGQVKQPNTKRNPLFSLTI